MNTLLRLLLVALVLCLIAASSAAQGVAHAERMVELVVAGDVEAYGRWRAEAIVDPEPGDAWRESFAALHERLVGAALADVVGEGDEATLVLEMPRGDLVALRFTFEPGGARRITGIGFEDVGPPDASAMLAHLGLAPPVLDTSSQAAFGDALTAWLDEATARDVFAGVVRIERDGAPWYEGAFGLADRSWTVPHAVDTPIRIGSITKTLMQVAVARLCERGVIDADATVAEFLPDSGVPNAERITVRHLLEHRSGLGDFDFAAFLDVPNRRVRRPADYFRFFVDDPPAFAPGEGERYSNAGYILLGAIVETVTGERYEDVIDRLVHEPAGMTRSGFHALDRVAPGVATGYWRCEGPGGPWCPNNTVIEVAGSPSGGSYASAADMAAFTAALRGGVLLGEAWTHWVFTGVWPGEGRVDRARWSAAWAGGGEGVSAVVLERGPWRIVSLANLDEPSGEAVGLALFEALGG